MRQRLLKLLGRSFSVQKFAEGESTWEELQRETPDLFLCNKRLPGIPGTVLVDLLRKSSRGKRVAILLMNASYVNPRQGAGEVQAYGADGFLPLPPSLALLQRRLTECLALRLPLERLGLLPPAIAREIDLLQDRAQEGSYYDLLGLDPEANPAQIKEAFYRLSLLLHPDRHCQLNREHPSVGDRIRSIYKQLTEGYTLLTDEKQRRSYNLALWKRGARRRERNPSQDEKEELLLCRTEEARRYVLESLELRGLGDLEGAAEAQGRACALEEGNEALAEILGSLLKLVSIIRSQR